MSRVLTIYRLQEYQVTHFIDEDSESQRGMVGEPAIGKAMPRAH